VTTNDRAWNEYIKKGLNFIEFGSFKSTTKWAQKEWPSQMLSSSSPQAHSTTTTTTTSTIIPHRPTTTAIATTSAMARMQTTKEKNKYEKEIAKQALDLAQTNVDNAMDLIRHSMPDKFLAHSSW
jgi:hypothetical protein